MAIATDRVATHELTLPQELVLMLLNEETGYFRQVAGWDLNCAIVGAILAELLVRSRIDMDREALRVLNPTETGNPVLIQFWRKLPKNRKHITCSIGSSGLFFAPRQSSTRSWSAWLS